MICKIKIIGILLLFAGLGSSLNAQVEGLESKKKKQTWPISISIFNHSWSFPLTDIGRVDPLYPGGVLGTEYYYIKMERGRLLQTFEVGGFLNKNQGSAFFFNSNLTYRFTARFGLMTEIGLGLGYFHGFHRTDTFIQEADGTYIMAKDNGVPASSSNIHLAIGYDLSKKTDSNIMPFIRYQWIASTSYWSIIGIRPNALLHVGVQIDFS